MSWKEKVKEIWNEKTYRFTIIALAIMIVFGILQSAHVF